jgi:plastocyanin
MLRRFGIVISLIAASAFFLAGCGSTSATTPTPTDTTGAASNPTATTASSGNATIVSVQNFNFSPASITIKAGTTVEWDGKSGDHEVKNDDGSTVTYDGPVPTGGKFTFTFTKAGTYTYHCAIHPSMHGTVIVTS